jgi:hypothetical protein
LGIPRLKEQSFAIIFLSTNFFGVFKVHIIVILLNVLGSLRAGSLGERERARFPVTFTCMRPIFGRRALIG